MVFMNFQTQLRKKFTVFFIKLIFIVFIMFVAISLIGNLIGKDVYKKESINFLDQTFIALSDKIISQMQYHNSNLEYINAIESRTIDQQLVATTNYSFSQSMNLRYSYNIYDSDLNPIYQETDLSSLRFKMYLSIIKQRIEDEDPLKFIIYSDLKTNDSSLIYYNGIYKNNILIGIDTYSIDINDLSYFLLPYSGNFIIANKFDSVIASNNYEILKSSDDFKYSKNYKLNGIIYKVTKVEKSFYTIYYLEERLSIEKYYFILLFLLIVIVVSVILYSNNSIKKIAKEKTKSIESIISDSNIVSLGKLDHKINEDLDEEFQHLARNINEMLDKLNLEIKLNKELSETNLIFEKRKLDSQFNPHFLYNSLETIRYSMFFDVKKTEKYILNLNQILRYSISNKINYSTLEDDLTYIEKYLELYKFKYKDKFTYNISVAKEMKDILVPKLVIQPLVENCIKYGFQDSLKLHIDIVAELANNLCYISVHDNGVSISDKVIEEIKRSSKEERNPTNHIGVHNVLRRFKILYPNSNIDVRRDGEGTVFEIIFEKKSKDV